MNAPVVTLRDVSRSFAARYVLRNVNLQIAAGEAVALVGPNGSGKTTLLRIIATLLAPSAGSVVLFDEPDGEDNYEFRRRIGALFMESFLYGDLSVRENLRLYAALHRVNHPEKTISRWLERMEMEAFRDEPVRNLSRGERQRIALIRSLLHDPSLLLWDEPTTGLDERARKLLNEVAAEKKGKAAILCATHDLPAIRSWADRTLSLEGGRIS